LPSRNGPARWLYWLEHVIVQKVAVWASEKRLLPFFPDWHFPDMKKDCLSAAPGKGDHLIGALGRSTDSQTGIAPQDQIARDGMEYLVENIVTRDDGLM
jgi:hypothetical protein